jgi:hypothetical protein
VKYFQLCALSRNLNAPNGAREVALEYVFRVRVLIEKAVLRSFRSYIEQNGDYPEVLVRGSVFGRSKKQGTSMRMPLVTCSPTVLCAGRCYAHDVLDAAPLPLIRGCANGLLAELYESGSLTMRANVMSLLRAHIVRAIHNAKAELLKLPRGFSRRPYIRFSHVGELVFFPQFANALAAKVHDFSDAEVDCVIYTRHSNASQLDPSLWVVNFTLDPASHDRRAWVPDFARIVYSAFGGATSIDAEVNFLEHHRWSHLYQIGTGHVCPATMPENPNRTCDGNLCARCFQPPRA